MELNFLYEMEEYAIQEEFLKICWEEYLWGVAIDSFSLTAPQFSGHRLHPHQSATDLFQHRGACPSSIAYSEVATALLDLAWWSSEYITVNSLLRT